MNGLRTHPMTALLGPTREVNFWEIVWLADVSAISHNSSVYLMLINATDEEEEEGNGRFDEEEDIPEVAVDASGHPILPTSCPAGLKSQQVVVRDVFTKAYSKFELSCYTTINILIIASESHKPQEGPRSLA